MPPGKCSSACAQSLEMQDALSVSVAPVVVFACGNPSRGDDALGPLLLDQLQIWLDEEGLADGFELISDFQWQVEHALDLVGRRLALFVDAGQQTPAPWLWPPGNWAGSCAGRRGMRNEHPVRFAPGRGTRPERAVLASERLPGLGDDPRQVAGTLEDREILSTRRHSRSGQTDVHPRAVFVDELIVGDP
jgi:hypothetical protein